MAETSFDIAAIHVNRIICHSMKKNAKNGRLSCMRRFYLSNRKAPISVDCPICLIPLSLDLEGGKSPLQSCCSKFICEGCNYANQIREKTERKQQTCPFCRHPLPATMEEADNIEKKRVEANDPVAITELATKLIYKENYDVALAYLRKAAELGDATAHYQLACLYSNDPDGQGAEKDEKKEYYHLEQAAIRGHPRARHNLACYEEENGRVERAAKHLIIAAKLGYDDSIQGLKEWYKHGLVRKMNSPRLFVDTRQPSKQQKVHRGKQQKKPGHSCVSPFDIHSSRLTVSLSLSG